VKTFVCWGKLRAMFLILSLLLLSSCTETIIKQERVEVIKYVDNNKTIIIEDPTYCTRVLNEAKEIKRLAATT
jgi:hypothetical protein